jgi:hypothetical protein
MKNEETQTFIYSLKQMLLNVEVNSLLLSADVGAGERPGGTPLSAGDSPHLGFPVCIALAFSFVRWGFSLQPLLAQDLLYRAG